MGFAVRNFPLAALGVVAAVDDLAAAMGVEVVLGLRALQAFLKTVLNAGHFIPFTQIAV